VQRHSGAKSLACSTCSTSGASPLARSVGCPVADVAPAGRLVSRIVFPPTYIQDLRLRLAGQRPKAAADPSAAAAAALLAEVEAALPADQAPVAPSKFKKSAFASTFTDATAVKPTLPPAPAATADEEDLDGAPMTADDDGEDLDGAPLDEDDVDGAPMQDDDDVDGAPIGDIDGEDLDGEAM